MFDGHRTFPVAACKVEDEEKYRHYRLPPESHLSYLGVTARRAGFRRCPSCGWDIAGVTYLASRGEMVISDAEILQWKVSPRSEG